MANYTTGPWHIGGDGGDEGDVYISPEDTDLPVICNMVGRRYDAAGQYIYADEDQANARLIAAAPDLHAACKSGLEELLMAQENVINVAGTESEEAKAFEPAIAKMRAALAKVS